MLARWGGGGCENTSEKSIAKMKGKMHVNKEVETEKWMESFKMLNATSNIRRRDLFLELCFFQLTYEAERLSGNTKKQIHLAGQ